MISIFYSYVAKNNHNDLIGDFLPAFSNDFQRKILKYRRWQDAQASLLGRLLLCQGLKSMKKKLCIEKLRYTAYNKPYFQNETVKFNISHSGNIVVCAITEVDEIGIDIELFHEIEVDDFKTQMTDMEWQRIICSNNIQDAFFEYWTQKEAIIKAHGMGLSIPLKSFEIIDCETMIDNENFFLNEIVLDDNYKCHLASKRKVDTLGIAVQEVNSFMFN